MAAELGGRADVAEAVRTSFECGMTRALLESFDGNRTMSPARRHGMEPVVTWQYLKYGRDKLAL